MFENHALNTSQNKKNEEILKEEITIDTQSEKEEAFKSSSTMMIKDLTKSYGNV